MGLKSTLKLNMEICYVPVAKLKDVQEMMANWNYNNKLIKCCSIASIAVSVMNMVYLNFTDSDFAILMCIIADLIMAILAFMVNKSNKIIYYLSFIGTMLFSFSASFIDLEILTLPIAIALSLSFLFSCFFSYKAIYNYEEVFLRLKERKGFPHFVFSTADMYADKMYLRDKQEPTIAEKRVKASFNSFNEEQEITDEETKRMNTLRYEELKQHKQNVSSSEYFDAKEVKHSVDPNKKYKYGLSLFGTDFIIPHDDVKSSTKEEKRRLMRLWNQMMDNLFNHEAFMIMLLLFDIIVINFGGMNFLALIYLPILVIYIFGTNLVKLNKRKGFVVTVGCECAFLASILYPNMHIISVGVVTITFAYFAIFILPGLIKWLVNYPLYQKLSKEEGFPSFFDTKKELYGDDLYIVEEIKPLPKNPKQKAILMNIGYDEEKVDERILNFNYKEANKENIPKENTAWNAFNYLENDTENSAYDEFAIYEEINRKRREAEFKEETIKPNKEMGRRKKDED